MPPSKADDPALSPCLGWSIVAVAFVADAFSLGGRALFGIVMLFWGDEFGMSTAELSSLMALVHICQGVATPLSGHAADRLPGDAVVGGGIALLISQLGAARDPFAPLVDQVKTICERIAQVIGAAADAVAERRDRRPRC